VVDAYLSPLLRRYVEQVASATGKTKLLFMQSNGGLVDAHRFQGKDAILSGPAGGVVGIARTSERAGFDKVIGFDMGGTSTDVSHYDGEFERTFETEVAGVRMRAPMMRINTVAAGGGSILHFDGARFRVGPDSAGANPGPACYRRGGPLAVTDANLLLGKIQPDHFPKLFGPTQNEPLDRSAVETKFRALAAEIERATGERRSPHEIAEGFLKIAVENMANAIKKISVQRGYDVTRYTLACFGGAGGQHACAVADALGMARVLCHPLAGVLSAYGMGLAELRTIRERSIEATLTGALMPILAAALGELEVEARGEIRAQEIPEDRISAIGRVHLRYAGTDTALLVNAGTQAELVARFEAAYRRQFGFLMPDKALVVEAVSVEGVGATEAIEEAFNSGDLGPASPIAHTELFTGGAKHHAPIFDRARLAPGTKIAGPAIVIEANATTVIEPGWSADVTERLDLVLTRTVPLPKRFAIGTEADPVMLEVFNNLFMSIAEQMGFALRNTAYSVNIKERLDFSCALFDGEGELVANAPHIPVHLGSMSESVKTIARLRANSMRAGDVYVVNAPYNGGTHLPDITVITPVFIEGSLQFFTASRGHHADVGGITPGSMPPDSRTLHEEGVLFDNFQLVREGKFLERELRQALAASDFPARNPEQNIADMRAQIAANAKGQIELERTVALYGIDVVHAYMNHVRANAEESVRRVIERLQPGRFLYEMDDGACLAVEVSVDKARRTARLDFRGTSAQHFGNLNAPTAVCTAAILYAFRCMVNDDIPLNAGCLAPLEIILPQGTFLRPSFPAAVCAGNVETSQCIVDTLFGAFGVVAAAQGTNNNFTFGNATYQYYETICGGAGAGPGFNGASAVHTHMTNTRLTDPEVLEFRFPVLLDSFEIRRNSGGGGKWRGGDGVIRRVRFLEPMTAAILSSHRRIPPFGVAGGAAGKIGENRVELANGKVVPLRGRDRYEMRAGDVFVIETPGGGGWGKSA
jgi:5-oxoprolinase (ATP-hydrolysing)